jgi:hypothetical protein
VIPFMEKILGDYLRDAPGVEAIVGDRVGTKTPKTLSEPWVRVNVLADPATGKSAADHHIGFYVQIDCFAGKTGSQGGVNLLARTVRALVGEMADHVYEGAVVTGAKVEGSRPVPDDSFEPTMDRYVVTATIWAHSIEAS